jgi:hypothetical protein
VVAARDDKGRPWATLLSGRPGFARAPDETNLLVDAAVPRGDALDGALRPGSDAGLLGIDLATRRRNRRNGTVVESEPALRFEVDQTFGNCPQYIHPGSSTIPNIAQPGSSMARATGGIMRSPQKRAAARIHTEEPSSPMKSSIHRH